MLFKDRQGTNLNRKRISIVSQTPNEIIADIVRADNPTEEGTEINAATFNQFQNEINDANEKSNQAETIASTANGLSSEAKTIAINANQIANNALTTAGNASTKADTAINTANSAVNTASGAVTTANEALSNSEDAVSISSDASDKSDTAVATANSASTTAQNAVSTSTAAETKATTALTTANTAKETATSALTKSQTALTASQEAKNTAERVEAALADRGATVKVAGVPQSEVEFTTDPQEQLNNKIDNNPTSIRNSVLSASYPVGAIYLSVSPINPSELFGGTWEALENRFLIGASTTYPVGSVGGEASHILTTAEMPAHKHDKTLTVSATQNSHSHGLQSSNNYSTNCNGLARDGGPWSGGMQQVGGVANNNGDEVYCYQASNGNRYVTNETPAITVNHSLDIQNTGGSQAHNNMPPYLAVYMWKRIG